jgi:hypothetical protein
VPLTVEAAMSFLPEQALDARMAAAVSHGRRVPSTGLAAESGTPVRLTHNRRLLAVGRAEGDEIKPEVVLA